MATLESRLVSCEARNYGRWQSWLAGLRDILPIVPTVIPFGMICGVGALNSGMSQTQAVLFSFAVFAGSSQIIATELMASGAPLAMIVLAALTVNLRFVMYSASISPYFAKSGFTQKLLISYMLTDQAFAVSINAFNDPRRKVVRLAYYFGAALCLLVTFQLGNLTGVLLGSALPSSLGLEFCIPLVFLALMIPSLKHRSMYVSVAVALAVTLLLLKLPYMLGVFVAALAAIFTGYIHMEATDRGT